MKNYIAFGLIAVFFIILLANPQYDFSLLNRGIYFTHGRETIEEVKDSAVKIDTLFAKEGLYGTILVDKRIPSINIGGVEYQLEDDLNTFSGDLRTLKINGKTQCGTGRLDMTTTGLLGGLPVILGKEGDVLNVGLGCGLTLGVLEKGSFENIDSIEIDTAVIEAAKEFNDIHDNALDNPRSNMIIDDVRNYLLKTDKKYDVIVNEPSPPFDVGSSSLITKEYFLLTKKHLKEDGIVAQWMPQGSLLSCDQKGVNIFYNTFASVFPYYYVFVSKVKQPIMQPYARTLDNGEVDVGFDAIYDYPNPKWKHGEVIIIGSLKPIDIEKYFGDIRGTNELIDYFREIKISDLEEYYLFSHEKLWFSEAIEVNTDDKPVLEFIAARNLYLTQSQKQCN